MINFLNAISHLHLGACWISPPVAYLWGGFVDLCVILIIMDYEVTLVPCIAVDPCQNL